MKFFYLIFFFVGVISCQTQNGTTSKTSQNDFEIIRSYEQKWVGGRPNVKGTYYKIELNQTTKGEVKFDSLYIDNQWLPAILEDKNPFVVFATISDPIQKYDFPESLNVTDNKRDIKIDIITADEDAENSFEGKNVLLYRLNGKKKYLEIGEFKKENTFTKP